MMSAQRELGLAETAEITGTADAYVGLNWSYSRRESVDQCTRRYFLQYYGNTLGDAEFKARVQFLRSVKNRYLRTGELVHLVIGTYFKKLKQGKSLSADWLTKWAKDLFLKDRKYSAHIQAGGMASNDQYPPILLDEILNKDQEGDLLLSRAEEQMLKAIQHFFTSPTFSEFRELGAAPESYIERKLSLQGFPVPVSGKVDLARTRESNVTIVDWKIGSKSDGGAESLQLATYGLWAATEFGVIAENVRIAKAYLVSEEVVEFKADQQAFANARVRILQDLERMVILHRYGRAGMMEAFSPNPQQGVCRLCPFREVCPEGKAVIHD
jgi:hypothetical protein